MSEAPETPQQTVDRLDAAVGHAYAGVVEEWTRDPNTEARREARRELVILAVYKPGAHREVLVVSILDSIRRHRTTRPAWTHDDVQRFHGRAETLVTNFKTLSLESKLADIENYTAMARDYCHTLGILCGLIREQRTHVMVSVKWAVVLQAMFEFV